jgi:hypothetical protein
MYGWFGPSHNISHDCRKILYSLACRKRFFYLAKTNRSVQLLAEKISEGE